MFHAFALLLTIGQCATVAHTSEPDGTYLGSVPMLGVSSKMKVKSDTIDFYVSGAFEVSCEDEPYLYEGGNFELTSTQKGDCIYDAMASGGVTLKSISYNAKKDYFDVQVQNGRLKINLELDKKGSSKDSKLPIHIFSAMKMDRTAPMDRTALRKVVTGGPKGNYSGSIEFFGIAIASSIGINNDATMALSVTGPATISCLEEPYTYKNGVFDAPALKNDGDCVHDAMAEYDVSLTSIVYNHGNDVFDIMVDFVGMSMSIELDQETVTM